jgi:excisionase family DNA binding protein
MPRKRHTQPTKPAAASPDPRVFTIVELAERWRASRHTVTSAIRAGRLQAFKVGDRQYRIREAEVLRYEQQNMAVAS